MCVLRPAIIAVPQEPVESVHDSAKLCSTGTEVAAPAATPAHDVTGAAPCSARRAAPAQL